MTHGILPGALQPRNTYFKIGTRVSIFKNKLAHLKQQIYLIQIL